MRARILVCSVVVAGLACIAAPAQSQSFKLGSKDVQIHGSIQQGFAVSDDNNFLTMNTDAGSAEMTDSSLNISSQITPKLRVGAQAYARKIGQIGKGQIQADWAYADYRFAPWLGVRGGKMKTALGLFNDTQDMEFLYTWALLPQGVYPADLRAVTIAHVGADVYGTVKGKKAGAFSYTGHYGTIPDDLHGGYRYGVTDAGYALQGPIETKGFGGDIRWAAPVDGLTAGYSLLSSRANTKVLIPVAPGYAIPVNVDVTGWRRHAMFADFQRGPVRLSAEVRKDHRAHEYSPQLVTNEDFQSLGWFASGAYRLSERVEVGSYYTYYVPDQNLDAAKAANHYRDAVASARFDVNRFWNVKVEGHFIDGYGQLSGSFARGFYRRDNTTPAARTNMFVVRTGITF